MHLLVAVASKYGATREIAEAIGRSLADVGIETDVRSVEKVDDVAGYDAVVVGSAVYMGQWLKPAREFVDAHAAELAARPTWLFSSGPLGDPPKPSAEKAVDVAAILEKTGAREHRLFAGQLDKGRLHFGDGAVATAVRAEDGDFREWDEIARWATGIAEEVGALV